MDTIVFLLLPIGSAGRMDNGVPMVRYHWLDHAKYEAVATRVQDPMEQLFNPTKPYLAAWVWVWIHDVDVDWPPPAAHARPY